MCGKIEVFLLFKSLEKHKDPQNMCATKIVKSPPTSEGKRPINTNRGAFSNITSDELILTKFKLLQINLQVTSHNKSINVYLILKKNLINLTNMSPHINKWLYISNL